MTTTDSVNVCDFLTELRASIAEGGENLSKYDAIGRLIGICRRYNLRMRQELVPADGDTNSSANNNTDSDSKTTNTARRVIISTDKFNSKFEHPVAFQCNGLVLDSDTWNVLSYPAPVCKTIYNKKALTEGIAQSKYEIYRVRDGTIVTLYWFEQEQRWCMSSANGFEINNYKWMGDSTYIEAFSGLMERYDGFSFDNLDKSKCYTLGFRYHDFHPFIRDPECIWFIQSCDLTELNDNNTLYVTTPQSDDIPAEVSMLSTQTAVLVKPDDAESFVKSALSDCKGSIDNVLRNHDQHPDIVYGFIFRDPTSTYGVHSHVVIESELMKVLRRLLYNFNDVKRDNRIVVDNTNRLDFITVRSYVNYMYRTLFISLMPQFTLQYDRYHRITNQVVNKIIYYMRNRNARQRFNDPRNRKTTFDRLVHTLIDHVSKQGRVNIHDAHTKSIIYDLVVTTSFTHMYYKLLVTESSEGA